MAAYKNNSNGTWIAKFYIKGDDGKSHSTTKRGFKTKREALEYIANIRNLDKGNLTSVTLESFIEQYFDDKRKSKKLKERTETMKRYLIDSHILPYFKSKKITEITTLDLERWQSAIKNKGFQRTYERMIANQMSAILNHAVTYYSLPSNPYKKIEKMGNSKAKDEAQYWEREEYNKFIATFEEGSMYFVLFELLFWTGMRIGEALSLTYNRINLERKELTITETYHREKKQDFLTEPKTESSVRTIKIPDFLLTELTDYYHHLYNYPQDARLFPIVVRTVEKQMANHIKKANVTYMTVHSLRHSHITYLISKNVPLKDIANRVGHRNINQIINTYGHGSKNSETIIANLLDDLK